jgi:predicted nucleic acid-binding protein
MAAMLLDTNVVVDLLRADQGALAFALSLQRAPRISVVTITELRAGQRCRREKAPIDRYIDVFDPIEVSTPIAEKAGEFRRIFGRSHGVDRIDAIIAATADIHGLPLATLNPKHFPMFSGLARPY